jgi:hypothetical protein
VRLLRNPGYSEKGSLFQKSRVFSRKRDSFRNEILFRDFSIEPTKTVPGDCDEFDQLFVEINENNDFAVFTAPLISAISSEAQYPIAECKHEFVIGKCNADHQPDVTGRDRRRSGTNPKESV